VKSMRSRRTPTLFALLPGTHWRTYSEQCKMLLIWPERWADERGSERAMQMWKRQEVPLVLRHGEKDA
jgi:hypothetical protein